MKANHFITIRNNQSLLANIVGSIGIKGSSMVISLLTLPAYMHYFPNKQILGVWLTLLSILNWVLTFDLGIGNGLRNHLVEALVERDDIKAKRYISSAYLIIGLLALGLILAGYGLVGMFNWNTLLNISAPIISNNTLKMVVRLVFIGVALQFFFKIIFSVLYAMQKTALSSLISLASNSLVLLYVSLFRGGDVGSSLIVLSLVYILTINVPPLIATFIVFLKPLRASRPNLRYYRNADASKIMSLGYLFFLVQLTLLIINLTNEFLVSRLFGPQYVVEYQVYNRVFSLFLMFFSVITIPIWSSVTKAHNEGRIIWIRKIYNYLNLSALVSSIACISIVPFFQPIVNMWLGDHSVSVNIRITMMFAILNTVMIFIYSVTCIANGMGILKPQLVLNITAAIVKIPLTILLSRLFDSWASVVFVNIVIMLPNMVIQHAVISRRLRVTRQSP